MERNFPPRPLLTIDRIYGFEITAKDKDELFLAGEAPNTGLYLWAPKPVSYYTRHLHFSWNDSQRLKQYLETYGGKGVQFW